MSQPIDVKSQFQTVFNTQTGKPEIVTPDELSAGGDKYAPIHNQTIKMVNGKSQVVDVPGVDVDNALKIGWQFESPASDQLKKEKAEAEAKAADEAKHGQLQRIFEATNPAARIYDKLTGGLPNGPDLGAPGVFAEKALNQLSLGVPETVEDYTKTPEQKAAIEKLNAENPKAALAGNIAGFAGSIPLYASGVGAIGKSVEGAIESRAALQAAPQIAASAPEVFQGARDVGLGTKLLAKTLSASAEGAALTAPNALVQASYGDPEKAAETLAWGIGTGGVVGLLGGAASEGLGALKNVGSKTSEGVQNVLQGETLKEKAAEFLGDRMGLNARDVEKVGGRDQLLNMIQTLDKEGIDPAKLDYETVQKFKEAAGKSIGRHIEAADKAIAENPELLAQSFNPIKVATEFEANVKKAVPLIDAPSMATEKRTFDNLMETILKSGGDEVKPMTIGESQDLKTTLGELAKFDTSSTNISNKLRKMAYTVVREEQVKALTRISDSIAEEGGVKTSGKFLDDLNRYRVAAQLEDYGPQEIDRKTYGKLMPGVGLGPSGVGLKGLLRMDLMGHALSAVGLGPLAYPIGWALDHVVGHWITDKGLPTAAKWILKQAKTPEAAPYIGGLLAKDGTEALATKIDQLPSLLGASTRTAIYRTPDALKTFLGPNANGLSKDKQYATVEKKLNDIAANPENYMKQLGDITSVFGNDPKLAELYTQKHFQQVSWLQSQLPKNPNPPQPFQKTPWQPSKEQKKQFLDKLEVANNPWTVVERIKDGSLSQSHVDALNAMYPKIKEDIVNKVVAIAYDPHSPKVSYGVKHGIAMLTGQPLGQYAYTNFQAAYQNTANQGQGAAGGGGGAHKGRSSTHAKLDHLPSLATPTQAVLEHQSKD